MKFCSIFHNSRIIDGASWSRCTNDLPEELKMNKGWPKMSGWSHDIGWTRGCFFFFFFFCPKKTLGRLFQKLLFNCIRASSSLWSGQCLLIFSVVPTLPHSSQKRSSLSSVFPEEFLERSLLLHHCCFNQHSVSPPLHLLLWEVICLEGWQLYWTWYCR